MINIIKEDKTGYDISFWCGKGEEYVEDNKKYFLLEIREIKNDKVKNAYTKYVIGETMIKNTELLLTLLKDDKFIEILLEQPKFVDLKRVLLSYYILL